ncbi:PglL family O-oligosaccharyltransferase [Marinobacterium lutimaris]|uniref:O-antigen polymerase n=1 Tax=Marinobacterium lutimaris TaxID=568106 RepID=A0A1H5UNE5_9GAMM|nr:O-antigen ligase family protein [Marinobacterium lutimaris]SEF76575.1 O-antigen polymerase [Marinobacterium lutimaris]
MPTLERTAGTRDQRVFFITFTLLALVAPFYYQPNLGGEGLFLPYNASIWMAGLLVIASGIMTLMNSDKVVVPRHTWMLMLFPAGIILGGFLTGIDRPSEWLIRLGVIGGGMLFWFMLFQHRLNRRQIDAAIYLLLAGIMLQGMIGLIQMLPDNPLLQWIPWVSGKTAPAGIYQQPNLQASMMATGLALALYQATTPAFSKLHWPFKALVFITLFLCASNVMLSGSRVGLLGGLAAVIFISAGRYRQLGRHKVITLTAIIAIAAGATAGSTINSGALKAVAKMDRLTAGEGVSSDARPHIYSIAWRSFLDAPLEGHGIGSFQKVFQDQRPAYYAETPGYKIDDKRFSHPHNELLYWMVEGGVIALASIAAAALAVLWQLIQSGWQRGVAMAGLLIPLSLHTQVELPFYISNVHWFVFLFLLFLAFQPGRNIKQLRMSGSARSTCSIVTLLAPALLVMFLTHSLLANAGLIQYLRSKGAELKHLQPGLNDLYFREISQYYLLRTLLYSDIHNGTRDNTQDFINWAEDFLAQIPDKQTYQDLARAYLHIGNRSKAIATMDEVHAIYPDDQRLARFTKEVKEGKVSLENGASGAASQAQPQASQGQ